VNIEDTPKALCCRFSGSVIITNLFHFATNLQNFHVKNKVAAAKKTNTDQAVSYEYLSLMLGRACGLQVFRDSQPLEPVFSFPWYGEG